MEWKVLQAKLKGKNHKGKHKTLLCEPHAPETQTQAYNQTQTGIKVLTEEGTACQCSSAKDPGERLGAESHLCAPLLGGEHTPGAWGWGETGRAQDVGSLWRRGPSPWASSGRGGKSVIGISGHTWGRGRLERGAGVMGKTPPSLLLAGRGAAWWCMRLTRSPFCLCWDPIQCGVVLSHVVVVAGRSRLMLVLWDREDQAGSRQHRASLLAPDQLQCWGCFSFLLKFNI